MDKDSVMAKDWVLDRGQASGTASDWVRDLDILAGPDRCRDICRVPERRPECQ